MPELHAVVLEAVANALEPGVDLEAVDVRAAGRRKIVRVVIDSDGGIDLDHIAAASQAISVALDAPDLEARLGENYVLEVTSPGVDRPLTTPTHWRRARGRLVQVVAAGDPVTGRIAQVDDSHVTLETTVGQVTFAFGDLGPGTIQIEFNRTSASADDE